MRFVRRPRAHARTRPRSGLLRGRALVGVAFGALSLVGALTPPLTSASVTAATPKRQLGINVLMYPGTGTQRANLDAAKRMFTYIRSLNANAVALCFQVYPDLSVTSDPITSNGVAAGHDTPNPTYLGEFVDLAHAAGLTVQLRPLINEDVLHAQGSWRGGIAPADKAAWFASYGSFLQPYFVMAHQHHVETFAIGAELTSMAPHNRYWLPLISQARKLTGSEIIYEANWNGRASLPAATFGYDAYQPVTGIANVSQATVQNLTAKMETNLTQSTSGGLPVAASEAQFSEVAIAALNNSWMRPWLTTYNPATDTIIRSIQANWFTAACNAFHDLGMRGIYFWVLQLNSGFDPTASADSADPTKAQPDRWQNTVSSDAIKTCFASNS